MGEKKYTREQANGMLPQIKPRLEELKAAYQTLRTHEETIKNVAERNGGDQKAGEWRKATEVVATHLQWFNRADILVKDIPQGLIDFPGSREGEEVLLCWKLGEPSVDFWHYPDTGFPGRRPL